MSARVIPPLATISPGISEQDALFTITSAQLISSSVPEVAPAAYNSGTTYAEGNIASLAVGQNTYAVYSSLAAGNIGHDPASSPAWWLLRGTVYGGYNVLTPYLDGDPVVDPTTHLEYRALANSTGAALSDGTKWQLLGPSNRWRAFDVLRNTKSTGPSGTSFTVAPGKRIDAIGLAGLVADYLTISLKVGGVEKWSHQEFLSTRNTQSWSDYFFGAFNYRSVTAIFDIPKYSGAQITLTFYRATGDVEIGGVWMNEAVYLGELQVDPDVDRRNFSTVDRRDTGELTLIRRRTIPTNSWRIKCPKDRLSKVKPLPELLNAVPALWIGSSKVTDAYFDLVTLVAVYTRFTITPGNPDPRIDLELEET